MRQMLLITIFLKKCCRDHQNIRCSLADCEELRSGLATGKNLISALDAFLQFRTEAAFSRFANELGRFCYSGASLGVSFRIASEGLEQNAQFQ